MELRVASKPALQSRFGERVALAGGQQLLTARKTLAAADVPQRLAELLDEEARRQYRARVLELEEELEEAESWNDPARAERARQELEFIQQELSQALGLGGRERKVGSAAERARVNVQRRIRDAIRRIESHHPGLGKHLDRSVRTGTYCAYEP